MRALALGRSETTPSAFVCASRTGIWSNAAGSTYHNPALINSPGCGAPSMLARTTTGSGSSCPASTVWPLPERTVRLATGAGEVASPQATAVHTAASTTSPAEARGLKERDLRTVQPMCPTLEIHASRRDNPAVHRRGNGTGIRSRIRSREAHLRRQSWRLHAAMAPTVRRAS